MENRVTDSSPDLRQKISAYLREGSPQEALQAMRALWRSHPSSSTAGFLLGLRSELKSLSGRRAWRLAILRSFTVEPVVPLLEASAMLEGIDLTIHTGAFNAYSQEILDRESSLYKFAPDAVILALQTRDVAPELWERPLKFASADFAATVDRVAEQVRILLQTFRERSRAHVILHAFDLPSIESRGILGSQGSESQGEAIRILNYSLRSIAAEFQSVHILDYAALVHRHGSANWYDPLKWLTARLPVTATCLKYLAHEWLRFTYAMAGTVRKVLVTDLDNTLWGGLAGEEGLEAVVVGQEHPGAGYRNFQRALLDLSERGILLAIASKNNEADALYILEQHKEILLRPSHFAAMRIGWQDKAQSLREIAAELNVGLDSLVFVDDNPAERERIRRELPDVGVIDLPSNPMLYESVVRESILFERLVLTAEDRERTKQYQQRRERQNFAQAATSIEEFYRSLEQRLTIVPVRPETLARVAQLTQKTNQFNMTTRRYSEEQIRDLAATQDHYVFAIQVEDRFGDNGIVGVVITKDDGLICEIDTFLLSCRVIGRTVETGILSFLVQHAHLRGKPILQGVFSQTNKNAPAAGTYANHGFSQAGTDDRGSIWQVETGESVIPCPEWIEMRILRENAYASYAA